MSYMKKEHHNIEEARDDGFVFAISNCISAGKTIDRDTIELVKESVDYLFHWDIPNDNFTKCHINLLKTIIASAPWFSESEEIRLFFRKNKRLALMVEEVSRKEFLPQRTETITLISAHGGGEKIDTTVRWYY